MSTLEYNYLENGKYCYADGHDQLDVFSETTLIKMYKGRTIPADVSDSDCNEVIMKDIDVYNIITQRGLKYHDEETNEDMIEFHVNSLVDDVLLAPTFYPGHKKQKWWNWNKSKLVWK
eukprot:13063512-Ditylum_brightwellii.AAC.1